MPLRRPEKYLWQFSKVFGLVMRQNHIVIPREGGSVTSYKRMLHTQDLDMGTRCESSDDSYKHVSDQEESMIQSSRSNSGIKLPPQRQLVQKKRTRAKLPKLVENNVLTMRG